MSLYVDCITFGFIFGAFISASHHMGILEILLNPEEGPPPHFFAIPIHLPGPQVFFVFFKIPFQVQGLKFGRQGRRVLESD